MDELKNKQVFLVIGANFLGIPTEGLTIIPAVVHQQHGENVHCFAKMKTSDKEILVTVYEEDVFQNIKEALEKINKILLKPKSTNELDKQSD
jgi:ribosome-associated translation inhibitor RaiA